MTAPPHKEVEAAKVIQVQKISAFAQGGEPASVWTGSPVVPVMHGEGDDNALALSATTPTVN